MGTFHSWIEQDYIQESNARKRAVKSALLGTGTKLPGSYAACPSTNPVAMDVANKTGHVGKAKKSLWSKFKESKSSKPDYSLDKWISQAKDLGDDVNSLIHKAEDDDEKIDKELKKTDNKNIDKEKSKDPEKDDKKTFKNFDDFKKKAEEERTPKQKEAWGKIIDKQKEDKPVKDTKSSKKQEQK